MNHILYHANCADGFASACIARHALFCKSRATSREFSVMLHPVTYETNIPIFELSSSRDTVIFVDFTPPEAWLSAMTNHPSGLHLDNCLIIDHHKKAEKLHNLKLPFTSVFDLTQSGTMLTWKHFFPQKSTPPPLTLILLQHYDLGGVWNDPTHPLTNEARWLVAYLMRCLPRTPEVWTSVLLNYAVHQTNALNLGARLYANDQRIIRAAVKAPHWVNIGGLEAPALNGIPHGLLNDALHELLMDNPDALFAAAWSVLPDSGGVIKWSLRSRKGGFDCSDFCHSLDPNGGGHPCAAGFSTTDPVQFV